MDSDIIVPFDIELARRIKNRSVIGDFRLENGNKVDFVYESKGSNSDALFLFVGETETGEGFKSIPKATWVSKEGLGMFNSTMPSFVMIETNILGDYIQLYTTHQIKSL